MKLALTTFSRMKWLVAILVFLVTSCTDTEIESTKKVASANANGVSKISNARVAGSFFEDFESGTKTAYASANVILATGSWNFSDALIGTLASDSKTGLQAVRIRNTGIVSMNFDLTTGVSVVNIAHATYGSDGASAWELWMSTNGRSSYNKVGATVTTSSASLNVTSFVISTPGTVSFQIRKVSGGSNRINMDEFEVVPFSTPSSGADNDNMGFGNPSDATATIANENNYLIVKTYYSLSYNRSRATPNWVSWYVGTSSLGNTPRQDDFRADTSLPSGWYEVGATSFSGSGFDRGHNCPSADRTSTVDANSATFLMDNMIPQAPNNNQHTWANLESYARTLVNSGNEVYIIMGSYGIGGTGSNGLANTVDNGRVTVPNRIWKVVVVIPQGSDDINRVTTTTRVIAVDTPNTNSISSSWGTYRTSVDAIESATGYDLLSILPNATEAVLESKVDTGPTN